MNDSWMGKLIGSAVVVVLTLLLSWCYPVFSYGTDGKKEDEQQKQERVVVSYVKDAKEADWPSAELKDAFSDYWSARFQGEWEKTFKRESPFFKEVVLSPKYEKYISLHGKRNLLGIDINEIRWENKNLIAVSMNLKLKDSGREKRVYLLDNWVYVGEKWYHVINDGIYFPEVKK